MIINNWINSLKLIFDSLKTPFIPHKSVDLDQSVEKIHTFYFFKASLINQLINYKDLTTHRIAMLSDFQFEIPLYG